MVEELLQVYKHLVSLRSVPLLEEAYRHVLADLEIAFNVLLEDAESDYQCSLVPSNPYAGKLCVLTPLPSSRFLVQPHA